MTNEVAIKETTLPQTMDSQADMLAELGMSQSDIVLPRLMLMQNTSEAVGADKAKMGDVITNLDEKVLGGINSPISFIPLTMYKTWMVYDMSEGSPKFKRIEPVTPENEGRKWESMEDGKPTRFNQCMNYIVLLRKDCAEGGDAFPVVISFKRTSYQAGRMLSTQLFKQRILKRAVWSRAFLLTVTKAKNETNYYAVFGIQPDTATTLAEQEIAQMWAGALKSGYKVAEDEEVRETPVKPAAPDVVIVGNNGEDLPF